MAFVFIIGISLTYYFIKKKVSDKDSCLFLDYAPSVIIFSIIGARIFYILGDIKFYLANPLEMIMINHGGLSIFGAIFAGLFSLLVLSKVKKFDLLTHGDAIAVVFPLCQAIGRFGNYFNQEAYGCPTDGFLKLYVDMQYRRENFVNYDFFHPAFLYESILDLFLFFLLVLLLFKKRSLKKGQIICLYLILYSIIRMLVEYVRVDSVLNIGRIPIAHIICFFVLAIALFALVYLTKKHTI